MKANRQASKLKKLMKKQIAKENTKASKEKKAKKKKKDV